MADEMKELQRIDQLKKDVDEIKAQISKSNGEVRADLEARARETDTKLEQAIALISRPAAPVIEQTIKCTNSKCGARLKLPATARSADEIQCGRCGRKMKLQERTA